jgi:hypothetical protein
LTENGTTQFPRDHDHFKLDILVVAASSRLFGMEISLSTGDFACSEWGGGAVEQNKIGRVRAEFSIPMAGSSM